MANRRKKNSLAKSPLRPLVDQAPQHQTRRGLSRPGPISTFFHPCGTLATTRAKELACGASVAPGFVDGRDTFSGTTCAAQPAFLYWKSRASGRTVSWAAPVGQFAVISAGRPGRTGERQGQVQTFFVSGKEGQYAQVDNCIDGRWHDRKRGVSGVGSAPSPTVESARVPGRSRPIPPAGRQPRQWPCPAVPARRPALDRQPVRYATGVGSGARRQFDRSAACQLVACRQ